MPESKVDVFYTEIFGDTPPTLDSMYPEVFGDSSPKLETVYIEIFGDTNQATAPTGEGIDPEGTGIESVGVGHIGNFGVEVLVKRNPPPETYTDNFPLYIYGSTSASSGTPLFVSGEPHRGDIPLYTAAIETGTRAIRPLYTHGAYAVNTGIPLYMYGYQPGISGIPLYTKASAPFSGIISLYIQGAVPTVTGIPLYVGGLDYEPSGIPLYLHNRPETSHIALYIADNGERQQNGIPLYLYNSAAFSGMELVVWGIGLGGGEQTDWHSAEGRINLYIRADGAENQNPLFIAATTGEYNDNVPLYMGGLGAPVTGLPLFIGTQYEVNNDTLKLYTHGF